MSSLTTAGGTWRTFQLFYLYWSIFLYGTSWIGWIGTSNSLKSTKILSGLKRIGMTLSAQVYYFIWTRSDRVCLRSGFSLIVPSLVFHKSIYRADNSSDCVCVCVWHSHSSVRQTSAFCRAVQSWGMTDRSWPPPPVQTVRTGVSVTESRAVVKSENSGEEIQRGKKEL